MTDADDATLATLARKALQYETNAARTAMNNGRLSDALHHIVLGAYCQGQLHALEDRQSDPSSDVYDDVDDAAFAAQTERALRVVGRMREGSATAKRKPRRRS